MESHKKCHFTKIIKDEYKKVMWLGRAQTWEIHVRINNKSTDPEYSHMPATKH